MDQRFEDRVRDDDCLTADAHRLSIDVIHGWLTHEAYWAKDRDRAAVETSLENSYLYGVLNSEGATIACARMITDHATFGWLCDVFVDATERGRGLGTWMVQEIVDHWMRVGVRRVLLGTRDAHEVYARVGFVPLAHPERLMQIDHRLDF